MRRKYLIIIILIALAAAAGVFAYLRLISDPEYSVKKNAVEIKGDSPRKIEFTFRKKDDIKRLQAFYFIPEEGGEYRFTLSDIVSDSTAGLGLYVADENFEDYLVLKNYEAGGEDGIPEELKGDSFLEKGQKYYIMTVVIGGEDTGEFGGSVLVSVSRKEEEPEELKTNGSVTLSMKEEGQNCALFKPEESAYYRFDTTIVSKNASRGFSSVASISSDDDLTIPVTEGIAWLEEGRDYHVWAEVSETGKGKSKVRMTCRKMNTLEASGTCDLDIKEDTLIEYTAEGSGYLAVYSVSNGDPAGLVYETPGVPLRADDNNAQKPFSNNSKDFAMVFNAEAGKVYGIAVYRDFRDCRVKIEPYIEDEAETEPEAEEQSVDAAEEQPESESESETEE